MMIYTVSTAVNFLIIVHIMIASVCITIWVCLEFRLNQPRRGSPARQQRPARCRLTKPGRHLTSPNSTLTGKVNSVTGWQSQRNHAQWCVSSLMSLRISFRNVVFKIIIRITATLKFSSIADISSMRILIWYEMERRIEDGITGNCGFMS